ncbi:MAG: SIMPL domain-containing protein [Nitrospirota bacterium]|nr:SIMPL domain-containing protein [Nitrospirota bacterium]
MDERSIIVISGTGEERVRADTAIVSLMVKTKEDKFQAALDKNIAIRKEVKSKLLAAGVPEENVEMAKYSSTPSYSWLGDKPTSYGITNEIMITIDKESQLLLIANLVDTIKEVYFLRTELKHTKKQPSKTKALERSLDDVIAKKQLYEKSLGISLSPVRVVEQAVTEGQPVRFTQEPKKLYGSLSSASDVSGEFGKGEGTPGFGEIVYKAQTHVEFTVHPKRL